MNSNLKPFNTLTVERQREIAKMGGAASAKARSERKTLKEALLLALSDTEIQDSIVTALIKKAQKGDVKAYQAIEASIGEAPKNQLELDNEIHVVMEEEMKDFVK